MRLIICEEIAQISFSEIPQISFSLDGLAPHIGEDHEQATGQQGAREAAEGRVEVWRVLQGLYGVDHCVRVWRGQHGVKAAHVEPRGGPQAFPCGVGVRLPGLRG